MVRARRIENEWKLLAEMAAGNPGVLHVRGRETGAAGEVFRVDLGQTPGPVKTAAGVELRDSHRMEFRFPRFFPAVPIEGVLETPVFHPNVDADSGFVCLWTRACPGDTIAEALYRMQRIIAWDLVNMAADHVMQREAVEWSRDESRAIRLPGDFIPLELPQACGSFRAPRPASRQRLYPHG